MYQISYFFIFKKNIFKKICNLFFFIKFICSFVLCFTINFIKMARTKIPKEDLKRTINLSIIQKHADMLGGLKKAKKIAQRLLNKRIKFILNSKQQQDEQLS